MHITAYALLLVAFGVIFILIRHKSRAAGTPDAPLADPASVRMTAQGAVIGYADQHQTHAWLGIPYAQAPVGALRWKAPRAPLSWQKTREALTFSPIAVQFAGVTINAPARQWNQITGSEDCLYLNVFAPRMTSDDVAQLPAEKRLPVMVWIHGGANTVGTAAAYETLRNLAGKDQLVVVSMNYRLGIFGWFSLPELLEQNDTAEDRSGNFGTLDIIASLQWVQQNCAAFGGDPDNVTIFGESAGALNVYSMLASPLAKGLFHKAIAQSPLTTTFSMAEAQNFHDAVVPGHKLSARELLRLWLPETAQRMAKDVSANEPMNPEEKRQLSAFLMTAPAAHLLGVIPPASLGFYNVPTLFRDGTVMPLMPMKELFKSRDHYNVVPIIMGSNRDEYKIFMSQYPEFVHLIFGKIPVVKNIASYNRYAAYMSELWKASCVDEPATNMINSGNPDVWVYRFDWDEHPAIPFIQPANLLGAAHVIEVPFVLRDLEGEFDPFNSTTKHNLQGRRHVSDAIAGYWTTFAWTGTPNRNPLPEVKVATLTAATASRDRFWSPWTVQENTNKLMVFDTPEGGDVRMIPLRLSQIKLKQQLAQDSRFNATPRERIHLYARMFCWSPFADQVTLAEFDQFALMNGTPSRPDQFEPLVWP